MQGTLTVITPGQRTRVEEFVGEPLTLQHISEAVGGLVEVIPLFKKYGGARCVAFCNEEGKIQEPPMAPNRVAQSAWEAAVGMHIVDDFLAGPVAIAQGDDEFMAAL